MAKTTIPMIRIHNVDTDEIIDRPMNDEEYAIYQQDLINTEAKIAEETQRLAAKNALYERMGITAEEAKLFFA